MDLDPIIYNSQIKLSILQMEEEKPKFNQQKRLSISINNDYWEIDKNGSILVKKLISEMRLYQEYRLRILAIDFGSPQLFSIANITIIPVSVSRKNGFDCFFKYFNFRAK